MKISSSLLSLSLAFLPFLLPAEETASPMAPAAFAGTVAQVDLLEIQLGEVTQTNTTTPEVKNFGAYMLKSHSEINKMLGEVAARQGLVLPSTLNADGQATLEKLSALKGRVFDTTYIPAMVAGHTEVLAMLKNYAATSTDPALKAFAEKITPIIAVHLEHAKAAEADLKKAGAF